MKILVVEDDPRVLESLQHLLSSYHYAVDTASDGEAGWQMADSFGYDLIVLDVRLPKLDGVKLCRQLREQGSKIPILLLTGQDGGHQKALSLNAGADDYVVKPFDAEKLIARIQALLRRGDLTTQPVLSWGHLSVDPSAHRVTYGTQLLAVTPKEFAILELFLRNPQVVFKARAMLAQVWESAESPGEEAVRVHIKELRRKLQRAGAPKNLIQTVYRRGYHLNPMYSAALAQQPEEQLTTPQIAELKAANTRLRETLDQLHTTQAELRQKNQALEQAHQALQQERQQLQQAQMQLETRVASRTAALAEVNEQCQLRESQWQALFDQALDAIVIADDDGRYVDANPTACDLFGATQVQLSQSRLFDFGVSSQDFALVWERLLQQGRLSAEMVVSRTDQTLREAEFTAIAHFVPGRHLLIFRDISERKRQETKRRQAEADLKQREARLQRLTANVMAVLYQYVLHPDGTDGFTYISPRCREIYELEPEVLLQDFSLVWEMTHPEDVERVRQINLDSAQKLMPFDMEFRLLPPSGGVRWVRAVSQPERQPNGDVIWDGLVLDISGQKQLEVERQQAEVASLQSQEVFRLFAENSDAAIWINQRAPLKNLYVNPACETVWGRSPQELNQQPDAWLNSIHPEDQGRIQAVLEEQLQGKFTTLEYRIVRPDGDVRWLRDRSFGIRNTSGQMDRFGGIAEDITAQKQLEFERQQVESTIQKREEHLSLALELGGVGSWDWQIQADTVTWNETHYRLFGYQPGEVASSHELWRRHIHPEDIDQAEQALLQAMEKHTDFEVAYRLVLPDGGQRWVVSRGRGLYDETGQPTRMVGVIFDVTDYKQLELTLQRREAHQRALIDAIPDLIERIDRDGVYLEFIAPPNFAVISNAAEIIGSTVSEQLPPGAAQQRMGHIRQALQTQSIQIYEQDLSVEGKSQIEEVRVVPYNENEVLLLIRDITDRKRLERANQVAQRQLSDVLDTAIAGIIRLRFYPDTSIQYDYISPHCERNFGYTVAELMPGAELWRSRIHPEDWDAVILPTFQSVLNQRGTSTHVMEYRFYRKDGAICWILAQYFVEWKEADHYWYATVVDTDITARKQAENQLQQLTQRLALATQSARIGVWELDLVNDHLVCDECMHDMYGLRSGELNGTLDVWRCRVHPDDWPALELQVQAAIAGDCDYNTEFRIVQPSGAVRHIEAHGLVLRDPQGTALRSIGVNWDITDRKQAEQKIQEQAALLDIASDAIIVSNLDQQIVYWNQRAERLYGWSPEEAIGQPADLLLRHDTTQTAIIMAQLQAQGEWQGELGNFTKSGELVTVAGRWTLAQHDAQSAPFILSVNTDITEQKRLEAKISQAKRLDGLGRLASGIAHDLNNVFTPILTMAQLLSMLKPDLKAEPAQAQLHLITESAKQGASMVRQILTFARGSNEEQTVVDLAPLLTDIATVAQQSFPSTIEIVQDWPLSSDPLKPVLANPPKLHQMFMNLCTNARDAMTEGGVLTLSADTVFVDGDLASRHLDAQVGDYVVVTVSDTGTGISQAVRDRIFDPFFTTKPIGQGTGLGLAITLGIVNNYGGFLQVFSEAGQGTEVQVYLPATEATPTTRRLLEGKFNGNGELVLVVDDDVVVQRSTQALLESHHYTALIANDGVEAAALYRQHQDDICLVVLDVMMPNRGGIPLVQDLKALNPSAKVIDISGLDTNREPILAAGANVFLTTPYPLEDLLGAVHDLMGAE
ncbi:MAG: PAS domain-containing protein [Leptolyngbyaceae cyanobacterium]